ncbi:MAG: SRPBCC family protein [Solirubrobacteraceae bacterium]|jgi:hypothetical protein
MSTTLHRSAEITLRLPREHAMPLFTAEGERRWAEGWEPHYPDPTRRDGPGAVFTTAHGSHQTTWIMVDHQPEHIRYARVTPGVTGGTVAVDVLASDGQLTRLSVTYDLTALGPAGETWLESFDAAYASEIASWATDIAAAIDGRGSA